MVGGSLSDARLTGFYEAGEAFRVEVELQLLLRGWQWARKLRQGPPSPTPPVGPPPAAAAAFAAAAAAALADPTAPPAEVATMAQPLPPPPLPPPAGFAAAPSFGLGGAPRPDRAVPPPKPSLDALEAALKAARESGVLAALEEAHPIPNR